MSLPTVKLVLTPLIVLAASLAARRWGGAVGGWLVGLPLTSGPVALFLAIEHGPAFAAEAAGGSLAGVAAQAAFCAGYAACASRGVGVALAAGAVSYAASAAALVAADLPQAELFLVAVAMLAAVLSATPRRPGGVVKGVGWGGMAARVAATTALVVGLTSAASRLGPAVSGATASFPLIGASIAAFAHLGAGPAAGVAVLRGMTAALYAFAVFFLVLAATLTRLPISAAFALAAAAALAAQGATLRLVRPRLPDVTGPSEGAQLARLGRRDAAPP